MNILKGFFAIEGIDGSGKTTLKNALATQKGIVTSMQPSLGPFGKEVREILKHNKKASPQELLDLFIKDRAWHQEWILGEINKGFQVILDRYIMSTMAYQGLYFSKEELFSLNQDFFIPQMTFYIHIDPQRAFERKMKQIASISQQPEIFEQEEIQKQIQKNYETSLEFLKAKGYPTLILDGNPLIQGGSIENESQTLKRLVDLCKV